MSHTSSSTPQHADMSVWVFAARMSLRSAQASTTAAAALPFGHLAQSAGLPVELLASERDLVARSEALIADDLMTWEPLDDGADFRVTQH